MGESPSPRAITLRSVAAWFAPHRYALVLIFAAMGIEMVFHAAVPMSFKLTIDRALLGGEPHLLFGIVAGLGVGVVLVCAAGVGRDYYYALLVSSMIRDLRRRLFVHLQKLPISYFTSDRTGETLACFSGNMATIENSLTAVLAWVVLPGMQAVLSAALLFYLDWRLALLAMLIFPLTLLGPRIFAARASRASYQRKQIEARALAVVQENLGAQVLVKGLNLDKQACAVFEEHNRAVADSSVRVSFLSGLIERSAGSGILTLQVVVLGGGALLVQHGSLSLGSLVAFQTLFTTLSYSLLYVAQYLPSLVLAGGAFQQISAVLRTTPQVLDAPDATPLPRLTRELRYEHVTFGYTADRLYLQDVNLRIRQGESVAFVGPSGCGKTTMLSLLLRFYDPLHGAIFFDDQDLRSATQESLRRQLGIVFQESILFNTSIRENIRMGNPGATDAEIEEAARAAGIDEAIRSMPQGYETNVGERGAHLSGGQRQRTAIARALVGKPPILILDEATSALDPATEAAIEATLARLARGRTLISVTHRLASVTAMDSIYVFNDGRVVEQGRHEELLQRRGVYAQLWEKQAGFRIDADGLSSHLSATKLAQLPIMQLLPLELQQAAAELFVSEHHPQDRLVIQEGDPADRFYLIVRGKVEVLQRSGTGEQRRVRTMEVGDFFGEVALLFDVPRTASIRTLLPTLFLSLTRVQFLGLLERAPSVKERILEVARQRQTPAD